MNKRQIGSFYEEMAAKYLEEQGVIILERNYRCKQGEVDLIGEDQGTLLFVEVKYRKNEEYGYPAQSVTRGKQLRICKVASYYCYMKDWEKGVRYDVISICKDKIQWLQDAFVHQGYNWW